MARWVHTRCTSHRRPRRSSPSPHPYPPLRLSSPRPHRPPTPSLRPSGRSLHRSRPRAPRPNPLGRHISRRVRGHTGHLRRTALPPRHRRGLPQRPPAPHHGRIRGRPRSGRCLPRRLMLARSSNSPRSLLDPALRWAHPRSRAHPDHRRWDRPRGRCSTLAWPPPPCFVRTKGRCMHGGREWSGPERSVMRSAEGPWSMGCS